MEKNRILELWKEKNIAKVEFIFNCGGDSMGDTSIQIWDDKGEEISDDDIVDFFDSAVYNNVQFYENSDGHYQGESGTVIITLNDDDDDDEGNFKYEKSSQEEYDEQATFEIDIVLNDDEIKFIENYVSSINGSTDTEEVNFNYSTDFIMTDEMIEIEKNISNKIFKVVTDYSFDKEDEHSRSFNYGNVFSDEETYGKLGVDTNTLTFDLVIGYTNYVSGDEF